MKQHEVVELVLRQCGGYATLGQLYHAVVRRPEWQSHSLTPFASIRRIVQEQPAFFRIRPGLWGLSEAQAQIGRHLALPTYAPLPQVEEYSHSYYQGLLVELGNFKRFGTCVPAQDKNKAYLKQKLADVTTLPGSYDFTFADIMGRARTVDVTWFNERRFPAAFFEVEHMTDISHSLDKFVEFQDFRVGFWIVADAARRGEYELKVGRTPYRAIREGVKFLDYETLSDWHTKAWEMDERESALSR